MLAVKDLCEGVEADVAQIDDSIKFVMWDKELHLTPSGEIIYTRSRFGNVNSGGLYFTQKIGSGEYAAMPLDTWTTDE